MNKKIYLGKPNGQPVTIGDELQTFRGEKVILQSIIPPQHPGSTGRIGVIDSEGGNVRYYFPSVCDLSWHTIITK